MSFDNLPEDILLMTVDILYKNRDYDALISLSETNKTYYSIVQKYIIDANSSKFIIGKVLPVKILIKYIKYDELSEFTRDMKTEAQMVVDWFSRRTDKKYKSFTITFTFCSLFGVACVSKNMFAIKKIVNKTLCKKNLNINYAVLTNDYDFIKECLEFLDVSNISNTLNHGKAFATANTLDVATLPLYSFYHEFEDSFSKTYIMNKIKSVVISKEIVDLLKEHGAV